MSNTLQVVSFQKKEDMTVMELTTINHDLDTIYSFLEGHMEVTMALPGSREPEHSQYLIVSNDEGKIHQLPPTIAYLSNGSVIDYIAGNAFIVRRDGEDFGSMTEDDLNVIRSFYHGHGILKGDDKDYHVITFDGHRRLS